jgi:WD40 repeat protein/DNA-binding SARP family transcriptional activator
MDFRILGPLEVRNELGVVELGGVKPRAVLAVLLLHADEAVSAERLALALWGEDAPAGAAKTVQVYVSRLRKSLGDPAVVATTPAGYRIRLGDDELDAARFGRLFEDGRRALGAGRPEHAAALLRDALQMWRGPPLGDLASVPFAPTEITRLEEQRASALEARVDADLAAGRHAALVGELQQLVSRHPTREHLASQLMLALYRCGRQAEALEAYRDARTRLVDKAGIEPGPELRRLHEAVLRQDPSLDLPAPAAELPDELDTAAAPPLAGREAELEALRERWKLAREGHGGLVAVTGAPGIGKTRLAAELAADVHPTGARVLYAAAGGRAERALNAVRAARESTEPALLVADGADRAGEGLREVLEELGRAARRLSVLVVATGDDAGALESLGAAETLTLEPLAGDAVAAIAAGYGEHLPIAALDEAGGVPRRVHELAGEWARERAARRVGAAARRAAAGRMELRSMEAEVAGGVADLQAARERADALADDGATVVCPFKGLASFDVEDAEYFFGRERLVAELAARLVGAPLLAIVGASGSGKSSVLRAGLLPALAGGVLPGSAERRQIVIRPGEHPLKELNRAGADVPDDSRTVLAVDQFEEVFTACRDERERAAFMASLVHAAQDVHGRCVVVLAVRADHYERCAAYPELSSLLAANHVLVTSMRRDELIQAVERPARRVGLRVEPELTDALVADVEAAPGALPLLSAALLELWQQRDGRRLRHAVYERAGGIRGAVARLAEEAYGRLDPPQQAIARSTLVRLAVEGPGGTLERRRVPLTELGTESSDDVARVVELFTERRLLTVSAGSENAHVEVAHEALLREWPRLRQWIQDDRESLRIHRGVTVAAEEWRRLDRDDGALFRGTHLTEANEWRTTHRPALNELEREFLDASQARREGDRAVRRRNIRIAFAGLFVALAAISAVAVVALYQGREAGRQRDTAASRELAARATTFLDVDPGLSLALALQALSRRETEQAENVLRQATLASRALTVWPAHGDWVHAVAPSTDGRLVATGGRDGAVRVWNVRNGRRVWNVRAHPGAWALGVSLSPDGRRLATTGDDGIVAVWELATRSKRVLVRFPRRPPDYATSVEFSPDGRRIMVPASLAGTVRVVPVSGDGPVSVLAGHRGRVLAARFSPDGTKAVTGGDDGARIWDLASRASTSLEHPAPVAAVDYSRDGRRVATAGADGVVRVWDAGGPRRPLRIDVDELPLTAVRFSDDGRRLVTAGEDGVVRVFGARGGPPLAELRGHSGTVLAAAFVPGTDTVVSGGEDEMLRRWALPAVTMLQAPVTGASFARDGRRVVSGGQDGAVRVWDTASGAVAVHRVHPATSVARFSPDGRGVASAGVDGTARITDPASGASRVVYRDAQAPLLAVAFDRSGERVAVAGGRPRIVVERPDGGGRVVMDGHEGTIRDVAFNPSGDQIASASDDGTARLWDAATGKPKQILRGHGQSVVSVAYSPDGRRVATAGADGTVRIWSVGGERSVILRGHQGGVNDADFNAAGDRVVSAGNDGTIRIWSADGGETLVVLDTYEGPAHSAQFSVDGRRVVSSGAPGIVRVSACEVCGSSGSVMTLARTRAARELSPSERQRLLPRGG